MPIKTYLAAPGPTPIPPEVQRALAQPMIYHRAPGFAAVMEVVRDGLKVVFQTTQEVLVLTSSGTGAMEAAICNLTSPGEKVMTIEAGKFGERWGDLGKAYGLNVIADRYEYGLPCDPARVEKLLQENPDIRMICVQACETSTGVIHPVRELAQLVKKYPKTLLVVDAITGLGIFDLPMDAWGIDVLIGGSQKAFMLPPGLAFIALSERAWQVQKASKQPRYYFDLEKEQKTQVKNQNAYTPGVSLIVALREALTLIQKETLPKVFSRHALLAKATRGACEALHLQLFPRGPMADGLTAVHAPDGMDSDAIVKHMRNQYGITIAGGQGTMKGKIFRLAHMGYASQSDVVAVLSALECTLQDLGYKNLTPGAALAAAQKVFIQAEKV